MRARFTRTEDRDLGIRFEPETLDEQLLLEQFARGATGVPGKFRLQAEEHRDPSPICAPDDRSGIRAFARHVPLARPIGDLYAFAQAAPIGFSGIASAIRAGLAAYGGGRASGGRANVQADTAVGQVCRELEAHVRRWEDRPEDELRSGTYLLALNVAVLLAALGSDARDRDRSAS